jgi:hypothetical protein
MEPLSMVSVNIQGFLAIRLALWGGRDLAKGGQIAQINTDFHCHENA